MACRTSGNTVMLHPVQQKVRAVQRRAWRLRAVCGGGLAVIVVAGAVFLAALADYACGWTTRACGC